MKYKWIKHLIRFLARVAVITMLSMAISVAVDGMYLLGIPSIKEVQKVTVSYPELTDEIKQATDFEQVELAVKLTGFLKYSIFEKADLTEEPMIAITYYLRNGESISVSANKKTVWWNGKAYAIKKKGQFIKLAEGIFFFNEVSQP